MTTASEMEVKAAWVDTVRRGRSLAWLFAVTATTFLVHGTTELTARHYVSAASQGVFALIFTWLFARTRRTVEWMKDEKDPIEVTTGDRCPNCGEGFVVGERGYPTPHHYTSGKVEITHYHHECIVRMVVGSVGHQTKQCPCFGGKLDDPPGMSRREAAREAFKLMMARTAQRVESAPSALN